MSMKAAHGFTRRDVNRNSFHFIRSGHLYASAKSVDFMRMLAINRGYRQANYWLFNTLIQRTNASSSDAY